MVGPATCVATLGGYVSLARLRGSIDVILRMKRSIFLFIWQFGFFLLLTIYFKFSCEKSRGCKHTSYRHPLICSNFFWHV
jgi:hypothetical protein